jgi:beta-glucosidase
MGYFQGIIVALLIGGAGLFTTTIYQMDSVNSLPTKPTEQDIERRVDSLLALMTLEEKIGQMVQYNGYAELTGPGEKEGSELEKYNRITSGGVGSMLNVLSAAETRRVQKLAVEGSRLGIPLVFGYDVIHGYKTMFPIPLAEVASWDLDAISTSAQIAAKEASAAGIHWTFAPMVDISRDARWGRIMEGAGEDPWLASQVAAARVKGFQGEDLSEASTIAACAKHFAGYGFAEGGRDYDGAEIGLSTLHNVVLPPFKACADAGVATFMNAFNDVNGTPATSSEFLQREILKGEWGFDGVVVSDWGSIQELIPHGVAADKRQASILAVNAGSDMDMEGYCYENELADLVRAGEVDEALIDDAARRVLRLKFRLGLMDDPYKYCNPEREEAELLAQEHLDASRDVARKSIVLLKNEKNLLPLAPTGGLVAVIGPLADDKDTPLGNWRGQAIENSAVSLLQGLKDGFGESREVKYAKGCVLTDEPWNFMYELSINTTDRSMISEAVELARKASVVVLAVGEDSQQSGEARSQANIGLAGVQNELVEAVLEANPNTVVVLMNGRPLAVPQIAENAPSIVEAWHLGSQAGHAIADVLLGNYNPAGKLPVSFPRSAGQCPVYYNHKSSGRPGPQDNVFWVHYTDEDSRPLWPFGFGLSYTTFEYGPLSLNSDVLNADGRLTATVTVQNTGKRAGEEIVQLYIRDLVGSVTRPIKELKGFQKIMLQPGERQTVTFNITPTDLAFYTRKGVWEAEPGEFHLMVGPHSEKLDHKAFKLVSE